MGSVMIAEEDVMESLAPEYNIIQMYFPKLPYNNFI